MRPRVFISRWMPAAGVKLLERYCEVDYYTGAEPLTKGEFIAHAREAHALVVFVTDTIDAEVIRACPDLRVISSFGKGHDNIDIKECTVRNILVTINPDPLTDSTADLAIGLLLAACRNIMTGDRQIRSRQFSGWHPTNFLGKDFHHSRLGIIGFGNIGQAIARRARGFAVEIVYYDIQRPAAIPAEKGVRCISDLDALLAESDFIIVAADFRPENHHLLGPRELGLVKRDCLIVNISRGSLVDEQAIAAALQSGRLGGYAADVFAFEDRMIPGRPDYIPDELLNQPDRTVFTPHLGTGTVTTRENLSIATARQLLAALRGQLPPGAVNGVQPGKMLL